MKLDDKIQQRFEQKIRKTASGHWLWTGSSDGTHGKFWIFGKLHAANRIAWIFQNPDEVLPSNKQVIRTCGQDKCINPDHHFVGTIQERGQFMAIREVCNGQTLDIVTAAEIRDLVTKGYSSRDIAAEFEISQTTAYNAGYGHTFVKAEKLQKRLQVATKLI